jgi:hypothetical protein
MEVYVIADVSMFERLTDRVDRIRILKRKSRTVAVSVLLVVFLIFFSSFLQFVL